MMRERFLRHPALRCILLFWSQQHPAKDKAQPWASSLTPSGPRSCGLLQVDNAASLAGLLVHYFPLLSSAVSGLHSWIPDILSRTRRGYKRKAARRPEKSLGKLPSLVIHHASQRPCVLRLKYWRFNRCNQSRSCGHVHQSPATDQPRRLLYRVSSPGGQGGPPATAPSSLCCAARCSPSNYALPPVTPSCAQACPRWAPLVSHPFLPQGATAWRNPTLPSNKPHPPCPPFFRESTAHRQTGRHWRA